MKKWKNDSEKDKNVFENYKKGKKNVNKNQKFQNLKP